MSGLEHYFEALSRLKSDQPVRVPFGTKITKDAVALEAGRSRGAIKKSRQEFRELIAAIESAASTPASEISVLREKLAQVKKEKKEYKRLYELALGRELMALKRVSDLEQAIRQR